jgi:hypothetical protein
MNHVFLPYLQGKRNPYVNKNTEVCTAAEFSTAIVEKT